MSFFRRNELKEIDKFVNESVVTNIVYGGNAQI